MPGDGSSVEDFYNRISERYSEAIQRCVPRYGEMLQTLIDYIPYDPVELSSWAAAAAISPP